MDLARIRSGLASLAEGTARGVERLQRGEVIAAAILSTAMRFPLIQPATPISRRCARWPACMTRTGRTGATRTGDFCFRPVIEASAQHGRCVSAQARMAVRQPGAGAQMLLDVC